MPTIQPHQPVPLIVPEEDGMIYVIEIPRMSEKSFAFLMHLLDLYKPAIVKSPIEDAPAPAGE